MIKTIKEYANDLTDEELGTLIKMSIAVMNDEEVKETNNRIINYLFKTQFKPAAKKYVRLCEMNTEKGKKGGGRPKKKEVAKNARGNDRGNEEEEKINGSLL